MKKVNQVILNSRAGDCMQAVIASLLEIDLKDVPEFINKGVEWHSEIEDFMCKYGYKWKGFLFNPFVSALQSPNIRCFKKINYNSETILSKNILQNYCGINGFFYATVYSPKYYNRCDTIPATHAVVVDHNLEIVHDPNPEYSKILEYPLSTLIRYNGIVRVDLFEK